MHRASAHSLRIIALTCAAALLAQCAPPGGQNVTGSAPNGNAASRGLAVAGQRMHANAGQSLVYTPAFTIPASSCTSSSYGVTSWQYYELPSATIAIVGVGASGQVIWELDVINDSAYHTVVMNTFNGGSSSVNTQTGSGAFTKGANSALDQALSYAAQDDANNNGVCGTPGSGGGGPKTNAKHIGGRLHADSRAGNIWKYIIATLLGVAALIICVTAAAGCAAGLLATDSAALATAISALIDAINAPPGTGSGNPNDPGGSNTAFGGSSGGNYYSCHATASGMTCAALF